MVTSDLPRQQCTEGALYSDGLLISLSLYQIYTWLAKTYMFKWNVNISTSLIAYDIYDPIFDRTADATWVLEPIELYGTEGIKGILNTSVFQYAKLLKPPTYVVGMTQENPLETQRNRLLIRPLIRADCVTPLRYSGFIHSYSTLV